MADLLPLLGSKARRGRRLIWSLENLKEALFSDVLLGANPVYLGGGLSSKVHLKSP